MHLTPTASWPRVQVWINGNESLGMCTISTRPFPCVILKAIRAGVGFGSETETNLNLSYYYAQHTFKPFLINRPLRSIRRRKCGKKGTNVSVFSSGTCSSFCASATLLSNSWRKRVSSMWKNKRRKGAKVTAQSIYGLKTSCLTSTPPLLAFLQKSTYYRSATLDSV